MSTAPRGRTLADLATQDAPLPTRRAASLLAAVARDAGRRMPSDGASGFTSSQVLLSPDGSVTVQPEAAGEPVGGAAGLSAGASVGRLLFELLVGRPPLSRADAVEPFLTASLPPQVVVLLSRSCSDAPGQWPELAEWEAALAELAGGQGMAEPPRERAARRRRRAVQVAAIVVLAAISVSVVLLAPRWWDSATRDEGLGDPAVQLLDRS